MSACYLDFGHFTGQRRHPQAPRGLLNGKGYTICADVSQH